MTSYLAQFINLLFTALSLAIFGRVIMSWISPNGEDNISQFLDHVLWVAAIDGLDLIVQPAEQTDSGQEISGRKATGRTPPDPGETGQKGAE